jgi:hypothetical protein
MSAHIARRCKTLTQEKCSRIPSDPMSQNRSRLLKLLVTAVAAATVSAMQAGSQFVTAMGWHSQGTWLRADFHTHTEFTDGSHSVEAVVAAAAQRGCDVVAITDHGDRSRKTGTPD